MFILFFDFPVLLFIIVAHNKALDSVSPSYALPAAPRQTFYMLALVCSRLWISLSCTVKAPVNESPEGILIYVLIFLLASI
jgi:hypothetical protein